MSVIKKLLLSPLYLVSIFGLIFYFEQLKTNDLFSLSTSSLVTFVIFAALVIISCILFSVFVSLAYDWRIVFPIIILASLIPLFAIQNTPGYILSGGFFVTLCLVYTSELMKLRSYLTFEPSLLLSPGTKTLITLMAIVFSLSFFVSSEQNIRTQGFTLPDSLLDAVVKFSSQAIPGANQAQDITSQLPAEVKDQLQTYQDNPELLKQQGIDPKILELTQSATNTENPVDNSVKELLKSQFQTMIEPYQNFIPIFLALMFFLSLTSFTSLLSLLVSPIIWLIFLILTKTGFIYFTIETREVKKMVV